MKTRKLKFYAKEDKLVMRPEVWLTVGQPQKYVGRKHESNGYPATKEPFECDELDEQGNPNPVAERLKKLIKRDGSLWAADRETAQACGITFQEIEYVKGAWIAKRPPKS